MRLRVLGCSGGIGGRHLRTTSLLLDTDILVDAGTGVCDLSLAQLASIDHIFLTHSHLDHIATIPFIVDTVGQMREMPLIVHALPATIEILRNHIFNWKVWPDFSEIPSKENPTLVFEPIEVGQFVEVKGRRIGALPANHVVPAVGYHIDSGAASLVFTGDTSVNEALWPIINRIENLKYLIIECAFCNRERDLAHIAKHLCPSMLAAELARLERQVDIFITHLKPGEIELTMAEIEEYAGQYRPRMLQNNQVIEF
ncbi:MAG TPA: 3',5'-cyclic-nucleotide phosphodiesterase [Burkholderiales bacterium]|nr:3',5'-cyclic-nucleotide phosphodiesterase [Burkholderiales bacterium]